MSYVQYLLTAEDGDSVQRQMDKIRGTAPFGAGLSRWVEDAPGFNLDKVQTPVRIEANGPVSLLQEWELYASLYSQHKTVDLIYFPHGTHIHQKPLERLESQQGNIDWLRFWLQGYEDPDPAKCPQYELWRSLKDARGGSSADSDGGYDKQKSVQSLTTTRDCTSLESAPGYDHARL